MGRCAGKSLALQRGRGPVPPRAARPDVGGATHVTSLAHVPGHEAEPRHGQAPGRAGQGGSARAQGCGGTGRMRPQERRGLPASCSSTGAAAARSGRSKNAEKKRRLLKIAAGRGGAGAAPGIAAPGQEQAPLTRGIKGTCHATPAPRARGQLLPGLSYTGVTTRESSPRSCPAARHGDGARLLSAVARRRRRRWPAPSQGYK